MNANLDGTTLLRYAHVDRSRDSGGTEQYLGQLNEGLLARNRMTIVQMHLVPSQSSAAVEIERHGHGRIIWIPVVIHHEKRSLRSLPRRFTRWARSTTAVVSTSQSPIHQSILRAACSAYGQLWSPEIVLSDVLGELLETYHVDLVLLHWLSHDVGPLISQAARRHIPYAVIHHFDNARLNTTMSRLWLRDAVAVGGVSNRNVPGEIQSKYVNVSDAVDSDFFSSDLARPVTRPNGFVVLLPSRVVAGKGHLDLLLAVRKLVESGAKPSVVFAGAVGSASLQRELETMACQLGLADRVLFLGRLTSEDLRDWYAASDVVVLPSGSEGLGRVLLEAQAMAKPVIAYDSGGVPEAFVPEKSGFLAESGDTAALAARLKFLLDNPTEGSRMGHTGRKFVLKHFPVSALVKRHEELYGRVLAGRRRTRSGKPAE